MRVGFASLCGMAIGLVLVAVCTRPGNPQAVDISYQMAQPILDAAGDDLPAELQGRTPADLQAAWPGWIARLDKQMRARVLGGEEDTLVNFLVFGTSFTKQARLPAIELVRLAPSEGSAWPSPDSSPMASLLYARINDLLRGLAQPGGNERLRVLAQLVESQGFHPDMAFGSHPVIGERDRLKAYILANAARMVREHKSFQKELEQAQHLEDRSEDFAERSQLYRTRGLSFDTSLFPNMAIEESLKAMIRRGLLASDSVHRVAVIGPGLDFTDKVNGYDFYPQQTLQCFAVLDSLLRLGLARQGKLQMTTFDISPQVNGHLRNAVRRARAGQEYVVQLPLPSDVPWKPQASEYWRQFGQKIGAPAPPIPVPSVAGTIDTRAVRIRASIVSSVTPIDMDIVTQHLELSGEQRFDLIVATNIFVYYDTFEQLLALANTETMLRPGGFLLSNNSLPLLNTSPMRSADYLSVDYSDRPGDGDVIVWYQRAPE